MCIRDTLVQPCRYDTVVYDQDGSAPWAIYNPLRQKVDKFHTKDFVGDPTGTWPAIEAVVDAEDPPLRLILGDMLPLVRQTYESSLQTWEAWQTVAAAAKGGSAA